MQERWSVQDDSPFARHEWAASRSRARGWIAAIALLAAGAAASYYYWQQSHARHLRPAPAPPAPAAALPVPPSPAPAIRHPLATAPAGEMASALPALSQSDAAMREALEKLLGKASFADFFYPDRIVLRVVATVDGLPRKTVPASMRPFKPAPGRFEIAGTENSAVIDPANSRRYAPYVRIAQAVDARMLVNLYVRFYPLFQKAYERLGYPKGYFNDRLIDAINDLLAAPEIKGPIKLARPKVLYQFADPDLEALSAGQKMMLRMGAANAAIVKAKLRQIRRELGAHAPHQ